MNRNEKELIYELLSEISTKISVNQQFALSDIFGVGNYPPTVGKEFSTLIQTTFICIEPVYENGELKKNKNDATVYRRTK